MVNAARDGNYKSTLLGVSSVDLVTPTRIAANPTTGALIIDSTSLYSGLDTRYLKLNASNSPVTGNIHFNKHIAVGANSAVNDGSLLYPSSTFNNIMSMQESFTDLTSKDYVEGFLSYVKLDPVANATSFVYAIDLEVFTASGNNKNMPFLEATFNSVVHQGTGTITDVRSVETYIGNNSSGTITSATAIKARRTNAGTGTITNGYGVYIEAAANYGGGTFTNNYGLYIEDHSLVGSTNSYNMQSRGANSKNYFQGFVGVGTSSPAGRLHVVGVTDDEQFIVDANATQTSVEHFFKVRNSAGTNIMTINTTGVGIGTGTTTVHAKLAVSGDDGNYPGPLYVGTLSTRVANFGDVLEITKGGGPGWVGQGIRIDGPNRAFQFAASPSISLDDDCFVVDANTNSTIFSGPTSGAKNLFRVGGNANFIPTSGTATFAFEQVTGGVNQTGGASGITRGLWVNPSIIAAADWRGIEITPNIGWALYQSGSSAKNYFAGEIELDGALNHDGTTAGFFGTAPATQQADGAALTNNVTVGGTTNTIANYTDLVIYANDAATIRNNLYQLARKLKIVDDALRTYGLLT